MYLYIYSHHSHQENLTTCALGLEQKLQSLYPRLTYVGERPREGRVTLELYFMVDFHALQFVTALQQLERFYRFVPSLPKDLILSDGKTQPHPHAR